MKNKEDQIGCGYCGKEITCVIKDPTINKAKEGCEDWIHHEDFNKRTNEMDRVIIESPYAGDVELNVEYARKCLEHSLLKGEAPLCSHLLYTQVLDDEIPEAREIGIEAGLSWLACVDKHVFYVDLGYSPGMKMAKERSMSLGIEIEERRLYETS